MKKSIQFLFAMCILSAGQNSYAGINPEVTKAAEKPIVNAPMVSPTRGQLVLIVTVLDEYSKPVPNANVYAPCTGLKPALTDVTGTAQFSLNGQCNCDGAQAEIVTSTCDEFITLKCSIVNQAFCKD